MKATISQLEYIIALDTYRHFGKAADNCFITQPTLSMQINKLEDNLGVKIFDRSRQPVMPTDLGKQILLQARKIINEVKKMEELIDDEKDILSGSLRVGIIPTVAPYILPLFATSFLKKYPEIQLSVEEHLTVDTINKLKSDEIDVGIVVGPIEDSSLREIPVYYEKFLAYAADMGTKEGDEIDDEDLATDRLWLLNEGHCFREQVLSICKNRNTSSILNYQSGSLESLKRMVDKQGGITLLPELATLDLNLEDRKNLFPFKKPTPFREVVILLKRDYLKKRMIDALQQEIVESLPQFMKDRSENELRIVKWK
jgi:LysR family hydrogen peroxide-inducible transcriptional activator